MMRAAGLAVVLLSGLTATAVAQTAAPSATPTNGAVGSAALSNGYPGVGGAVSLPRIANSNTTSTTTPLVGTATSFSTTSTNSVGTTTANATTTGAGQTNGAGGVGGVSGGATGVGAQSGGGSRGGGTNTAGAAGATGSSGGGVNWVLCPPNGAPGIEPLFAGTDLSCAPH